ncbi:TetR family transcriptional regulator [Antricoccus suffuscus]|uniref:TetR family transcriptional regulator n=1 Tax=Antricoccus suffuscus TaxID=1629062 RepID=A0A2T0ZZ27_9ACTN|nr:TetR/AcrR family transcriptional regulator [Antricoccus suffuscus]PRZ41605.1 TetR family transcriptional regulator [Antricoccus suffuscus]
MTQTPARRGRPPGSDTGDTQKRILDSATKLFARQGFHGTSVSEICKMADVQSGALYYHIKSKDELLWQILSSYIANMYENTRRTVAAYDDPEHRLRAMVRDHVTHIIRYRRAVTIELRDRDALSKAHQDEFQQARDDVQQFWQQALEDGVRAGVFRSDDRVITNSMLSMVSLVSQWYRTRGAHTSAEVADIIADFLIAGLQVPPGA